MVGEKSLAASKIKKLLAVAVLAAIVLALVGMSNRRSNAGRLELVAKESAIPNVRTIFPLAGPGEERVVLPADLQAFMESPILARVTGYLKSWRFDIGAHVRAGEVMAIIDAPELNQQLEQAKGDLAKTEARLKLAQLTSKRWAALRASTAVSGQSADEKAGDVSAQSAELAAARANVDRIKALNSFTQVIAPFSGVVTSRKVDIGALVRGDAANGQELFALADLHQIRAYVRTPQIYAARLTPNMIATLKVAQYQGRAFPAKVIGTSNAVSPQSRTFLVQLLAENPDGALWPGSFAEAHFQLKGDSKVLRVPPTALLFREDHTEVATVTKDGKVAIKRISIARDLGAVIEVSSGLDAESQVIDNPPEFLSDGDAVRATVSNVPALDARRGARAEQAP